MVYKMAAVAALLIAVLACCPPLGATSSSRHLLQSNDDTVGANQWQIANGLAATCGGNQYPASNWGGET